MHRIVAAASLFVLSCGRLDVAVSEAERNSTPLSQNDERNQNAVVVTTPPLTCTETLQVNDCNTKAGYGVSRWSGAANEQGEVLAIGVYETHSNHRFGVHPEGMAQVEDTRKTPHTLVLSSYEPVAWKVNKAPGSGLRKVVLAGYHAQRILNAEGFSVENASGVGKSFACAYTIPSNGGGCEPEAMQAWVSRSQGQSVSAFAGCYQATRFTVSDCMVPAPSTSWERVDFKADAATSACSGEKYVRFNEAMKLWVGAQVCSKDEYKLYLSKERMGLYAPVGDTGGHGQDHCELVSPGFSLPNDDDVRSGGCTTCAVEPWSLWSSPGGMVWTRSKAGTPFTFKEWTPSPSSIHTSAKYRCGVAIP